MSLQKLSGFCVFMMLVSGSVLAEPEKSCPTFLNHSFKRLHSEKSINLCTLYNNKPIVIVNTASHCGYTHQFKSLETLYQRYKDQGVEVIGFTSSDFKQAAKSEIEAATICYENYGVTFTMLAPTSVKGLTANAVFSHLQLKTKAPKWNFNKYLIGSDGTTIEHFSSGVAPIGSALEQALIDLL